MEVIVTHSNADCDAFASLVGASLLYPEATIVLGRRVSPRVRDFLALHREHFEHMRYDELDADAVQRVIVVDVRRAGRLADFPALVARMQSDDGPVVHIYDHHAPAADDLDGELVVVERVGATATILVEEMQRRALTPDPVECTLFMLAIYVDTGSLTYDTTTPRDAAAVGWLLSRGASLAMVDRYLRLALSDEQQSVLTRLLASLQPRKVGATTVAVGGVNLERDVNGLALIATHVLRLSGEAALIAAFNIADRKVQVIGRARLPDVHIGDIMRQLGGGGHAAAGAATIKTRDAQVVATRIEHALSDAESLGRTVASIMSTTVHRLDSDEVISAAGALLAEWGVTGAPVFRDGRLIGAFSRSFLRAAERDGRDELKVKSSMLHQIHSVSPDTTIEDAYGVLVAADTGRLFVLEGEDLVGVVSRSDFIAYFYGERPEPRWA